MPAGEGVGAVLAVDAGAGREGELAQPGGRAEGHVGVREVQRVGSLVFDLDAVEHRAVAEHDLGDAAGEVGALAHMRLDQGRGGALFDFNHIAGSDSARSGVRRDEEKFNRRVGGTGNFQACAISCKSRIHGDHGLIQIQSGCYGVILELRKFS